MPVKLPVRPDSNLADPDPDPDHDVPREPTTIDSVANPPIPPGANAEGISMPLPHFTALRATPVPPAKILEPTAPAGAAPAHPSAPGVCNATAAAVGAARPMAGNGQPPVQPPPPTLKSQLPQRASDIKPEFRDKYLAERQVRFAHTPGLYVWDGFLWIDSI
jgi:hypothetical protein